MKNIFHGKFTNVGGRSKSDKSNDADSLAFPPYTDSLYLSAKIDKEIFYELYKKLSTICVQNYSITDEKKMKKNAWESLSILLSDSEKKVFDDTLTKEMMNTSIKAFDEMALKTRDFERTLSLNVIKHFHDLSEDNSLGSTKKTLTSLAKDIKSNSEKVQFLQNQLNNQSSESLSFRKASDVNTSASTENKLMAAQATEESHMKEWENKKDIYLSKLFSSEVEEITTAEKLLEFFQGYIHYYDECRKTLMDFIPELQSSLNRHRPMYVFSAPLEDHLSVTNRKLSYVLETCIQELDHEETLQHEGIFRISGTRSKMQLLKNALNVMRVDDFISKGCNSAIYTGVLKQYLRELPNPLMTYELYDQWCEVGTKIRQNDIDSSMVMIKECLSKMQSCYYDNLVYLMQFLKKISNYESVNKMSASNLGLMLGPNLIRNKQNCTGDDTEASAYSILGSPGGTVLEFMISHFSDLFPNAPLYPTTPKVIKATDEKELEKDNKKFKQINDDDLINSGDTKLEDSVANTAPEFNENLRTDVFQRLTRDQPSGRQRSFRKQQAPPPPPQVKRYTVTNENYIPNETIPMRPESRPTTKTCFSKNEKLSDDSLEKPEELSNDTESCLPVSRPTQPPTIHNKKSNVVCQLDTVDKPTRLDLSHLKRPSNPPPPIPKSVILKDDKQQPKYSRKPSIHDETLSTSLNQDLSLTTSITTKKHQYSSSDVSHTSF